MTITTDGGPAAVTAVPDVVDVVPPDQPWTISIDFSDEEHCHGDLATTVAELPDAVQAALGTDIADDMPGHWSYNDLRQALTDTRDRVRQDLADLSGDADPGPLKQLLEDLADAADDVREHEGCGCGLDAWHGYGRDDVNDALRAVSSTSSWAVFNSGDDARADLFDTPTVDDLWTALNDRDGYSAVELSWDPATRTLSMAFDSYPSRWHGYAICLTEEQDEAAQFLESADPYGDQPRCYAAKADMTAVAVVRDLWDDEGPHALSDVFDGDACAAIDAVAARLRPLSAQEQATIRGLAAGWTASLDDLLSAGAAIAAA